MSDYSGNRRFTESGELNSILIIDNEHENVADLEIALKAAASRRFAENERVVYASSPDEAIRYMVESAKEHRGYSAIITDNHFDVDDGTHTIDGQDFLRIFHGNLGYCISHALSDMNLGNFRRFRNFGKLVEEVIGKSSKPRSPVIREIQDFMERNFDKPSHYQDFLENYSIGRVDVPHIVFYCGNPRHIDNSGLEGIDIVQKSTHNSEIKVIEVLRDEGILPEEEIEHCLDEHPRFNGIIEKNKCKSYNPRAAHVRRLLHKGKRFST